MNKNDNDSNQYYDERRTKQTVEQLLQKYVDNGEQAEGQGYSDYSQDSYSGSYQYDNSSEPYYGDTYNSAQEEENPDYDYIEIEEEIPSNDDYDSQQIYSQSRRSRNVNSNQKKAAVEYEQAEYSNKPIIALGFLNIVMLILLIAVSFYALHSNFKEKESQNRYNQLMATSSTDEISELQKQVIELTNENESLKAQVQTQAQTQVQTQAQTEPQTQLTTQEQTQPVTQISSYTVQKNDSVWKIAKKLCTTGNVGAFYQAILDENGMTSDEKLTLGQVIKIPAQ